MQTNRSFHQLFLILALCYPTAAFSSIASGFANRNNVQNLPFSSMSASNLYLRIPRGGSDSEEDAATTTPADTVTETVEISDHQDPIPQQSKKQNSAAVLPVLSHLTKALQIAGTSYSNALVSYPILTKSLTAGTTFFLSDYTAQRLENPTNDEDGDKKVPKHDWTRTLTSAAVGLFYFGPAAHAWYEMIFKLLPGTSLFSTLQKALLGQIIFGPAFTCVFFATSLMQGGSFTIQNWISKIKADLPGAWLAGVGFWPLVDFVSYALVPIKFIPLFINICSFVWTIYLSTVANRNNKN